MIAGDAGHQCHCQGCLWMPRVAIKQNSCLCSRSLLSPCCWALFLIPPQSLLLSIVLDPSSVPAAEHTVLPTSHDASVLHTLLPAQQAACKRLPSRCPEKSSSPGVDVCPSPTPNVQVNSLPVQWFGQSLLTITTIWVHDEALGKCLLLLLVFEQKAKLASTKQRLLHKWPVKWLLNNNNKCIICVLKTTTSVRVIIYIINYYDNNENVSGTSSLLP